MFYPLYKNFGTFPIPTALLEVLQAFLDTRRNIQRYHVPRKEVPTTSKKKIE